MMHSLFSLPGIPYVFKKKSPQRQSSASALPEGICRRFSLAEIKAATNNFHPDLLLGDGGLGPVFRGTIDDALPVVVKCMHSRSNQLFQWFKTELILLCQLRHPHLVSLIGFCHEQNQTILVYEYLGKGSLCSHLYGKDFFPLNWKQRLEICIGAARGLHYLHTGAKYAVIHRNITSLNILLDNEWSCKISEFGLSKMGPPSMSKASIKKMESKIEVTNAYMAPELKFYGELTDRSDVYSFGVVLFEVLCGRKVFDRTLPRNQKDMLEWVSKLGREGNIYHVIDPQLKGKIAPECFRKYLEIARSCVHYEGNERPTMGEVEVSLEFALELQKKADSDMEGIGECMYEEALFCTYFDLQSDYYGNRYSAEPDSNFDSSEQ